MKKPRPGVTYAVIDTAWGPAGLAWTDRGLCGLVLPGPAESSLIPALLDYYPQARPAAPGKVHPAARALREYFQGRPVKFDFEVDLFFATPFQEQVYRELMRTPRGRTRSYGDVARALGAPRAVRAVGGANARNRIPLIIPCHRIIAADGGLGGFSAPGGIETKKKLLELEQVSHHGKKSS